MEFKVIATEWTPSQDALVIVAVEVEIDGRKWWTAYMWVIVDSGIGAGIDHFPKNGHRLEPAEAAVFFPQFDLKNYRDHGD